MRKLALFVLAGLLAGASGALAQDVRYTFAQDVNFSKFKTYKWVSVKNTDRVDDVTAKQITGLVDAEMAKKGLTKTDTGSSDLYVGYQTAIRGEKELVSYGVGWGYGPGWGAGWYGAMPTSAATVAASTIYAGQLDVDLYDAARKELVWRGVVSKAVDLKAEPDKRQKNMEKAVAKLLKNYPPEKGK